MQKLLFAFFSLASLFACSSDLPASQHGAPEAGNADAAVMAESDAGSVALPSEDAQVKQLGCDEMDILFVIDNSPSMAKNQENLAQSFPGFIQVLQGFREGKVDYRVGVTTTAFPLSALIFRADQGGTLLQTQDMPQRWLTSSDPLLPKHFETLATVGTDGSREEQPLRAVRAALTDRVSDGINRGFLRDDALLAIVIITDEDDQSTDGALPFQGTPIPVKSFVGSLDELKGSRARWAAAVIAGGDAPSCTSPFGEALYASKLIDFVDQARPSAVFSSICKGDLSVGLSDALEIFSVACDNFVQ